MSPHLRSIVEEANKILRVDYDRLTRQNSWYNDSIINFITDMMCTNVVIQEERPPKRPKVLNTHFFNCLMGIEMQRADRILLKNIDKKSPCIIPIHRENHWTCALIFMPTSESKFEL
jgi:Ulp1 family protease